MRPPWRGCTGPTLVPGKPANLLTAPENGRPETATGRSQLAVADYWKRPHGTPAGEAAAEAAIWLKRFNLASSISHEYPEKPEPAPRREPVQPPAPSGGWRPPAEPQAGRDATSTGEARTDATSTDAQYPFFYYQPHSEVVAAPRGAEPEPKPKPKLELPPARLSQAQGQIFRSSYGAGVNEQTNRLW
mmetsp:Transcript_9138/g.30060  ORF Transcript_9138/g.30060 Transcript_9138/m.30060 type:complete len:188 (+) Transcript_9138:1-564(+)